MSIGSRVVRYHDGLLAAAVLMYSVVCGKATMLVLVDLFKRPVECEAQTVGGIASTLGKTNACCAKLGVGRVDSVAFVGFGQAGPIVLCKGNSVIKEEVVAIAQAPESLLNVFILCYLQCSCGSEGKMVMSSTICSGGPLML